MEKTGTGQVVSILPFIGDKVLMQLRDFKSEIKFPGRWGFFSGTIQQGEEPVQAAKRELFEEIGYHADNIRELGRVCIADQDNLVSYVYSCAIPIAPENLELHEGIDMALVSQKELSLKKVYSKVLQSFFPVAETSFIQEAYSLAKVKLS